MAKTVSAQVPSEEKECGRKTASKVHGATEGCMFPHLIQNYPWKQNREEEEENL